MTSLRGPELRDISCACLIVLDGWGIAPPDPGNAIEQANKPGFDRLWAEYPHAALEASGPSVGLPEGQMGNSEVGHLTLGAGAVVPQTLTLIDNAVADGALASNRTLRDALSASERVHLLGMVSDGGVHSGFGHLHALIELAAELQVRDLVLHCFTDGRDTSPTSGEGFLATLEEWCRDAGAGRVGTVVGRYWAMDRDRRWERIQAAYDMLVHGRAENHAPDGPSAARAAYERGETDEFIRPTTVGEEGQIRPSDSVLCFNFRPDRMREIVRALAEPGFGEGSRGPSRLARARGLSAGRAPDGHDRVPERLALPGCVHGRASRNHSRGGDRSGRRAPAARGRDREVRARDLFLQRRPRATLRRRATGARALPARHPDLRPQAADERTGDHGRLPGGVRRGTAALLDHQLRQRRHGRPHRESSPPLSPVWKRSTAAYSGSFRRCTRPAVCA